MFAFGGLGHARRPDHDVRRCRIAINSVLVPDSAEKHPTEGTDLSFEVLIFSSFSAS
jgi:hypothetical protein